MHEKKLNIVQEKKLNIDFQDRGHGGHLGFQIGTILAIFDLLVTPMLPTKFGVNWLLGFRIRTILAIFDLQVTQMLPTKFRVNGLLGLGEEAKYRFSRSPPWWPSWTYDRHDFSNFLSTSHPNASYQVSSQLAFRFRRRREKQIFKMAAMAPILDFRSA